MSNADHAQDGSIRSPEVPSAAVQEAAAWLATTPRERVTRPIIPTLRRQFGLSAMEAVEAVRQAQLKQARPGKAGDHA